MLMTLRIEEFTGIQTRGDKEQQRRWARQMAGRDRERQVAHHVAAALYAKARIGPPPHRHTPYTVWGGSKEYAQDTPPQL